MDRDSLPTHPVLCSRSNEVRLVPSLILSRYPGHRMNQRFHSVLLLLLPEVTAKMQPTSVQCFQWLVYQATGSSVLLWLVQFLLIMRGKYES